MDKVVDLNHLSRETVVGQGRPPRTGLGHRHNVVLRRVTQRGKPRRGHSLIFVSMAPRVLEIFRKATICADRETAPDRRECPDSISFPRHSDSEWFIENVTHNGEHTLGGVSLSTWSSRAD